jgi:Peptidase family M1 domain
VFTYARECLATRPAVWVAALPCAFLVAVPTALVTTALAPAVVSLLFTADLSLAFGLLPRLISSNPGNGILVTCLGMLGTILGAALYSRFFSVAVWASDDRNDNGFRAAWEATRRSWRPVLALNVLAGMASVALLGVILLPVGAGGAAVSTMTLTGLAGALAVRSFLRVLLTLAARHAVLETCGAGNALRRARLLLAARRHEAVAAWCALVALGGAVWIGGRLLSPVLQDTAFDYPSTSGYAVARAGAQLLVAVPLEASLIAAATALWTAVWLNRTEAARPAGSPAAGSAGSPAAGSADSKPWVARGLGALLVLALVGNALPTAVDAAYVAREKDRVAAVTKAEIAPEEAIGRTPEIPEGAPKGRTKYVVEAELRGTQLAWTTTIGYRNGTGQALTDLGVHIYPAAYRGNIVDIPFARELLANDLSGVLSAETEPGTLGIRSVEVRDRPARFSLSGTALTVELGRPLETGERLPVTIALEATLPTWPERYGSWHDTVLLGNWIPTVAVREGRRWRLDPFSSVGDPFYSEVADYEVAIETDDHLGVIGSGVLESVREGPHDKRLWRFTAPVSRDAAFAVAPFMRGLATSSGDTTVRSWYTPAQQTTGSDNLVAATSAVGDFSRRFGPPAYDEVEIFETQGFLGGMEYPGLIFTSGTSSALEGVPLLPELVRHVGFEAAQKRYVVGHEVAHQWWYAAVGNDQVREPWLDEGFAEISTRLWLQREDGNELAWRVTTGGSPPEPQGGVLTAGIDEFSSNRAYSEVVYASGSRLLLALRRRIGEASFTRLLRTWYRRKRFRIGNVEEFVQVTREVAGTDAARYLRNFR